MRIIKTKRLSDGKEVVQCVLLTDEELRDNDFNGNGLCLDCGEIALGSTEPDARNYECEYCGEKKVFGFQELAAMNRLKII